MKKAMNRCEQVKKVLADHGQDALMQNKMLSGHLQGCQACKRLLDAWAQIPGLLDRLPEHEPEETLVQVVREAASPVVTRKRQSRERKPENRRRFIAPSLASAAVLLAAVGLSRELLMKESPTAHFAPPVQRAAGEPMNGPELETTSERFEDGYFYSDKLAVASKPQPVVNGDPSKSFDRQGDDSSILIEGQVSTQGEEVDLLQLSGSRGGQAGTVPDNKNRDLGIKHFNQEVGEKVSHKSVEDASGEAGVFEFQDSEREIARDSRYRTESQAEAVVEADFAATPSTTPATMHAPPQQANRRLMESSMSAQLARDGRANQLRADPGRVEEIPQSELRTKADLNDSDGEFNELVSMPGAAPVSREYVETETAAKMEFGKTKAGKAARLGAEIPAKENLANRAAESVAIGGAGSYANIGFDFLAHYQQTQNLHFKPVTGYWANTYIPGDPEVRLLNARLAQWDRSWLESNAPLEQDIEPVRQPFDAPADNALALNLMADTRNVSAGEVAQGPTRLRLQVGIRGIEHRRGQRPAMNVGVVVDLPLDAPDEVRIATRALLDALLQSKQAGDRFSLVMTGEQGSAQGGPARSLVVPAKDFRFGSLQLAKQLILGQNIVPGNESRAPSTEQNNKLEFDILDLYGAIERAGAMVQQTDDPSRPLGSSTVLLISAKAMPDIERLAVLAHQRAKEGITLSVFPLGSQPQNSKVEKLVLAGLGNRRYLEVPGQARQLIEEELHAASRAVARAARLSIRLAPGVRLIDVVGSERLDSQRAQRVREIENSMDQRLSANLGIQADRGEDEDGIQIVIPSIFSGDSVTVLLDVVTDRPGAIADVSLRYKDLVFLRNGSLRGHLDLSQGPITRGPAELAVLKNLLSHHFVDAVEQAAEALGRKQVNEAITILSGMRATIDRARQALPAWANDPDLIHDQQVLDRYIAALTLPQAGAHQSFLADSLRYAAWAKTHRPLPEFFTRANLK